MHNSILFLLLLIIIIVCLHVLYIYSYICLSTCFVPASLLIHQYVLVRPSIYHLSFIYVSIYLSSARTICLENPYSI